MSFWTHFGERLAQDVRYGFRMLLAKPGFTAVAVLSLALGIGATTSIFSVVYAVLIDPYPYRAADRIGSLSLTDKNGGHRGFGYTKAQYLELKSRVRSMEDMAAINRREVVMTGIGMPEVVIQANGSLNLFDFFGVPPLFGRVFSQQEPVAVISYKFWQSHFQGSRDVLGKKVRLDKTVYTIIGVLPVRFTWMDVDAYTPMDMRPGSLDFVNIFYRIRAGVTQQQVTAEFQPILEQFRKQGPSYMYPEGAFQVSFQNVNEGILGKFANTLLALFGAVALLLLIACANVANLLLARAAAREGEMAVRVSIGATRGRLIRQLLTESVLLALTSGAFGIALAYGGVHAVAALMPEYSIPHEAVIALNLPVLWFALGISVLTGIVFGLAPALRTSTDAQSEAVRGSGRGAGVSVRRRRLHDALMIAEVTLSLVLLTGAGLAVKGLLALQGRSLGYDPSNVLTFRLPLGEGSYTQWSTRLGFFHEVLSRLRRLPGVESAAASMTGTPPWNGGNASKVEFDDRPDSESPQIGWGMVGDGYFESVRTRLLRGRLFNDSDIVRGKPVAVVTEDVVARYFAGKDPVGRHLQLELLKQQLPSVYLKAPQFNVSFEIVGVVAAARNRGLNEAPEPAVFFPYSVVLGPDPFILMRTNGNPLAMANQARAVIKSVDANQPITLVRTLEQWLDTATAYPRFATFLFGVFGGIGTLLAAAGVFSVVSYAVAQRTREFGIRMALGAEPRDVFRLVLVTTGKVVAVGLACGIALSVLASRSLSGRMEGMGSADPYLFVAIPVVLIVATMLACFLPARAATLIQPVDALRQE
jgi:putative ABC transport system permease protein